jgi:hypothetical protein
MPRKTGKRTLTVKELSTNVLTAMPDLTIDQVRRICDIADKFIDAVNHNRTLKLTLHAMGEWPSDGTRKVATISAGTKEHYDPMLISGSVCYFDFESGQNAKVTK